MSCLRFMLTCTLAVSLLFCSSADGAAKRKKVKAVQGKHYALHKAHGPHMILVTTLRDVQAGLKLQGMSAEQAADEIVYQLRRKGIPAYVFNQSEQRDDRGRYIARQQGIAILAGNFETPDHRFAKTVLTFIQDRFRPQFLDQPKNGAIIANQMAAQPFKRAFMVGNPLRSAEEMRGKTVDAELVNLNMDSGDISLLRNKGKYSLRVATFSGNSVIQAVGTESKKALAQFKDTFGKNLDESGQNAWQLATALRDASKYGYGRNYDAWVMHDRYKSYVTVGSFDSPDDPRLKQLTEEFQGKIKPNPRNGLKEMTPELFSIPKNPVGTNLPDKLWFFDETPGVVKVPGR